LPPLACCVVVDCRWGVWVVCPIDDPLLPALSDIRPPFLSSVSRALGNPRSGRPLVAAIGVCGLRAWVRHSRLLLFTRHYHHVHCHSGSGSGLGVTSFSAASSAPSTRLRDSVLPSPCVGAGGWSSAWGCCSPLSPSVTPLPASSGTTYSAGRARHDGRWGAGSSAAGATPLPA
jgi:hypothetical protein